MLPRHDGRRDDIDTWPGEHYKKTTMRAEYVGKVKPPEKDGYIYSPPAWMVCPECVGNGFYFDRRLNDSRYDNRCLHCGGTGRTPIRYTPEQWQEAGGILTDDTPCWQIIKQGSETLFFMEPWGDIKDLQEGKIIIATEAGRPPEDWDG